MPAARHPATNPTTPSRVGAIPAPSQGVLRSYSRSRSAIFRLHDCSSMMNFQKSPLPALVGVFPHTPHSWSVGPGCSIRYSAGHRPAPCPRDGDDGHSFPRPWRYGRSGALGMSLKKHLSVFWPAYPLCSRDLQKRPPEQWGHHKKISPCAGPTGASADRAYVDQFSRRLRHAIFCCG